MGTVHDSPLSSMLTLDIGALDNLHCNLVRTQASFEQERKTKYKILPTPLGGSPAEIGLSVEQAELSQEPTEHRSNAEPMGTR